MLWLLQDPPASASAWRRPVDFSLTVQVPGRPPQTSPGCGGYARGLSGPFVDRSLNQGVVRNWPGRWAEKSPQVRPGKGGLISVSSTSGRGGVLD